MIEELTKEPVIEQVIYSHDDVRNGLVLGSDTLKIGEYCFKKGIVDTFLSNPSLQDTQYPMVAFEKIDGDIHGRCLFFPSRMTKDHEVVMAAGACSLYVSEEGRYYSLGVPLMLLPRNDKRFNVLLYAGLSKMAVPLYEKLLKFTIFRIPCKWQPRNSKFLFQYLGFSGVILSLLTGITNVFLKPFVSFQKRLIKKSYRHFEIKNLAITPKWVEDIVLSDSHRYAEFHDKAWFDWVINNTFSQKNNDFQKLFGIFDNQKPIGFVVVKECESSIPEKHIDKITFGTIIEWGSVDQKRLSEYDINRMTLALFSKRVDIAQIASCDQMMMKRFRKYGFVNHGDVNIGFRDLRKKMDADVTDISNWRIRVGYSDVPFY